jgi:hypothetical protein
LLIQEQCGSQFDKCSCWFKHSVAVRPTLVLLEAHYVKVVLQQTGRVLSAACWFRNSVAANLSACCITILTCCQCVCLPWATTKQCQAEPSPYAIQILCCHGDSYAVVGHEVLCCSWARDLA